MICGQHLTNPHAIDNRNAAYSGGTVRLNGRLSFWNLYVSSTRVPYVALPSLDGNNADLPRVALLFLLLRHIHYTPPPYGVSFPSPNTDLISLLFRLRVVVCSIHSVPLLIPLDFVQTDFGSSFGLFLMFHLGATKEIKGKST